MKSVEIIDNGNNPYSTALSTLLILGFGFVAWLAIAAMLSPSLVEVISERGVDMSEEHAKAELVERDRRRVNARSKKRVIAELQDAIKTGVLQSTGEKLTPQLREAIQRSLKRTQAELADLNAGGSGTADGRASRAGGKPSERTGGAGR